MHENDKGETYFIVNRVHLKEEFSFKGRRGLTGKDILAMNTSARLAILGGDKSGKSLNKKLVLATNEIANNELDDLVLLNEQ